MAKPIRATPSLNKLESIKFVKDMLLVVKRRPNKIEQKIIDALKK